MRIRLSLVRGPVVRQQELASRRRALLLIPLLAIVGAAVFYVLLVNDARRAREVIRDTESRLAPLRLTAAQVGQLQAEIADLAQRRQALLGAAGRGQLQLSLLLTEISQVIPQDAWLQTLTVDAGTLTMTGSALQLRSVGQFVGGLEQSQRLEQVKVQNLQQGVRRGQAGRRGIADAYPSRARSAGPSLPHRSGYRVQRCGGRADFLFGVPSGGRRAERDAGFGGVPSAAAAGQG